jgi:hypothetical protein
MDSGAVSIRIRSTGKIVNMAANFQILSWLVEKRLIAEQGPCFIYLIIYVIVVL